MAEAFFAWYKLAEGVEAQFEVCLPKDFPIMDEMTLAWWGYVPFPQSRLFQSLRYTVSGRFWRASHKSS
jgi:hypothetical protein